MSNKSLITKKYTIKTQLHTKNNKEIITYYEEVVGEFNHIKLKVWHMINNGCDLKKHKLNTFLQKEYGISKRTANSIINETMGQHKAFNELKKYELNQLKMRINKLESNIHKKELRLMELKIKAKRNLLLKYDLIKYRGLKKQIVALKKKLNKYKNKQINLEKQISSKRYKITFGTKFFLKQGNIDKFFNQRDKYINYIGSKEETACNQMLQLSYNKKINQFSIKLRKCFKYKKAKGSDRYAEGQCYFNHHKKHIIDALNKKSRPLTYKIFKENNRYYLICTFEIQHQKNEILTKSSFGTIGVDFNKGFVSIAEVNKYGHLINVKDIKYRFGMGNKTINDLRQIFSVLTDYALSVKKDIVIEDLDFNKKRGSSIKATSKGGKKYNNMLNALIYSKFKEIAENSTYRKKVNLIKVNPAWTSYIGEHKYKDKMKLTTHRAAAKVIAEKGMGIKVSLWSK